MTRGGQSAAAQCRLDNDEPASKRRADPVPEEQRHTLRGTPGRALADQHPMRRRTVVIRRFKGASTVVSLSYLRPPRADWTLIVGAVTAFLLTAAELEVPLSPRWVLRALSAEAGMGGRRRAGTTPPWCGCLAGYGCK